MAGQEIKNAETPKDNRPLAPFVPQGARETEKAELHRDYYREICRKFYETLGGYQGWLVCGSIFAYAAAPELFRDFGEFPGLFVHGQMSSGKTVLTEWLMHLAGYRNVRGIGLLKGTAVGLLQQCENYSNLPLWADEYRQGKVDEAKEAILRDSYNRLPAEKWSPDGIQREMKTSFIVSGESTPADAAFRSRFPLVQVAASKRLENHYDWMQTQKENFFIFFRLLLERRSEFVVSMRTLLGEWLHSPQMAGVSERDKRVHGVVWASWQAMTLLVEESVGPRAAEALKREEEFLAFMIDHAKKSASDVTSETNVNVFWTDLITACKADEVPANCFRLESEYVEHPKNCPEQKVIGRWISYRLYIDPDATVSALQRFLVQERSTITLKRKDLRDQLSKNPGWIEGKFTKCFGSTGGMVPTKCWGFELDEHPMGYQEVTLQQVEDFIMKKNGVEADPRLGPLYALVFWLKDKEDAARRAAN